ncbi:ATP-binding protein [Bradyrhizobium sp. TZ2]
MCQGAPVSPGPKRNGRPGPPSRQRDLRRPEPRGGRNSRRDRRRDRRSRQLLHLAGEPGVGKSRLAQEAAAYARAQGARVVWGRCWEHGGAPAYWPWAQVLRGLSRGIELAQLSKWMGSAAAEIAQIAPELGNQIGGVPDLPSASLGQPENARFRLFDSLIAFLGNAAEAQPLLIVLDDLHEADPASLRMLVAFSRQLRGIGATAIATYRALEVKQLPEHAALIAQAEREGVAFPLLGLDESDIGKFIEAAWGVSANASLVRRLHDLTEGNPFFLSAVLRQMAAEGQLANGASSVPARLTLPRGVIEFIKGLIQPLREDARSVLDIASVVGRDFNLNRLQAASGLPREAVTDLLDQAESLELVHEVRGAAGRYSFRHALIRETLYDALPSARRRSLHRVVAEAIRGLGETREPYAEIAYHYCQSASPVDADAAIEYSRRAARTAEKGLAYEEAARHLGNAIEALALKRRRRRSVPGRTALRSRRGPGQDRRSRGGARDLPPGGRYCPPGQKTRSVRPRGFSARAVPRPLGGDRSRPCSVAQ